MSGETQVSARWSLGFSCVGHTYSHLFAPIFFVVALLLEAEFNLSHGEVISLIVVGNILFGVGAPVAGWISDRWSASGMIGVYFIGVGVGMILTGLTQGPVQLLITLSLTGLFGSIYHPVGFAWLVSQVEKRGAALGLNGVFGTIGPSIAAITAGVLTDLISWRAAFIVPGAVIVLTGIAFWVLRARGIIHDTETSTHEDHKPAKGEVMRIILVLAVTMLCTGLIYQTTSPALPKVFSERLGDLVAEGGVFGVGVMVALVYVVAGAAQLIVGRMCDKYPLKTLYIIAFVVQVPVMVLAAQLAGGSFLLIALVMVSANQSALPVENTMVAKYAPKDWRALAFGLKFILAFGISGLGALLEGQLYDLTGGFYWMFVVLACIAAVGFVSGWLLPSEPKAQTAE
ncbi:MFS transporter [Magnetovibrio sp. PR-2]|uniref:MFS transporter n=1 Tax=Magnetovibrio sp. PR-2 TaxID=3120356 RepID=UPI002FCDE2DE